jgi:hypothetical protein
LLCIVIEKIKTNNQKNALRKVKFLKGTKLSGILPSIKEITKCGLKYSKVIRK